MYNGHGDVVQTVSQTGEIENQYDYDIFGNPILTIEQGYTNAIRYAGEFYDSETGLYYLRARYYNPYTGRFISEDSYWGEDTNPLSLNLYTYCHNDPINFIDPTGHWQQGDETLTVEGQKKVKALTDAYWATEDEGERKKIHEEANQVRKDYSTNTDNGDSFAKEVNKALGKSKTGYMTADEWKETSKKNNRRSKGKRSARSKKEDFRGYADKILNEAEKYSDYVFDTDNYKEEISIISKTSGETKAKNQIRRDMERERIDSSTNDYTSELLINIDMSNFENKMAEAYYDNNIKDRYFDNEGTSDVTSILLYQSGRMKGMDTNGNIANDMTTNDYTKEELLAINFGFIDEIVSRNNPEQLFSWFKLMAITFFAKGELEDVVLDMINHFEDGSGTDYSNPTLTKYVSEHQSTIDYIEFVREALISELIKNNGNLGSLEYDENSLGSNELYQNIMNNARYPVFNTKDDRYSGLTIAINDTWGNTVEVNNYRNENGEFSGTLHFSIYDHFGLDQPDVEKVYGQLQGFRAWFALQHDEAYEGKYKPFATVIEIDVPFEGVLDK